MEEKTDILDYIKQVDLHLHMLDEFAILRGDWQDIKQEVLDALGIVSDRNERIARIALAMQRVFDFMASFDNVSRAKSLTFASLTKETPLRDRSKMLIVNGGTLMILGVYLSLREICIKIMADLFN